MWNVKKLWRTSAVSAAAFLAVYLAGPFGGTAAKGAAIDQSLPVPLSD